MSLFWHYISDLHHWRQQDGILQRLSEHVVLSLGALLCAAVIAIPVGAVVGHSRRGDDLPILFGVLGRLLPPLAVLTYFALKVDTGGSWAFVMLIALAMPPLMSAAYAGVRLMDRSVVESARGAGMLPGQVLRQIELPITMPKLVAGARRATVTVVAATAVAAYVGAGGLGRLIIDGQTVHNYGAVATGGVLLAVLTVVLDAAIRAFGSGLVSPALSGPLPVLRTEATVPTVELPVAVPTPPAGH